MTQPNHNQPATELSAEVIAKWNASLNNDPDCEYAALNIEAYAAQQTATLQAKVSELEAEVEHYSRLLSRMSWYANHPGLTGIDEIDDRRDKEWDEFNNALSGLTKAPLLFELKTENEQLHAKLAMFRDAVLASASHKQTLDEKLSFIEYMTRYEGNDPATKGLFWRLYLALQATEDVANWKETLEKAAYDHGYHDAKSSD